MFRLSRLTDYAVALLTRMAQSDQSIWAAPELAAHSGLPLPTVSKILKRLAKADILKAQRGALGGYRLARAPAIITAAEIIEAMDGPIAITDCAEGGNHGCKVESLCPMSGSWTKVNQTIRQALNGLLLSEMAGALPAGFVPPVDSAVQVLQKAGD